MLRKVLVIIAVAMISLFSLNGCKKSADTEEVKTAAEYKAEAEQEIDEENMDEELERIEKEVGQDISEEE